LDEIGNLPFPRVKWAHAPVLIEVWQSADERQCHLVNYAEDLQTVTVDFGESVTGKVVAPNFKDMDFKGHQIELELDVYAVLRYQTKKAVKLDQVNQDR
jgi:hypothetical protein